MPDKLPEPKISYIPAREKRLKNVAIYCRVSTMHKSQEESLENQITGLKQFVADNPRWLLYRIYADQDSGGNTYRPGFQDMILDCYENRIDVVLVKSISDSPGIRSTCLKRSADSRGWALKLFFTRKTFEPVRPITMCSFQP